MIAGHRDNWWTRAGQHELEVRADPEQSQHHVASQIPASIISAAGIESGFTGILSWKAGAVRT